MINKNSIFPCDIYQKIIHDWNQTDCNYPKDKTIHQLFEEQVKKTPNDIALVFKDQTLTYDQLNKKANQLAYHIKSRYKQLSQNELEGDTLIALVLDRSIEMIVSILAVLKSGAAYVPILPEFPKQRIDYILKDTKAQILISQSHLEKKLNELDTSLNIIYADKEYLNYQVTNPITQINHQSLAYVIYTSGTTGKPKGVMIEHQGVVNRIQWMQSIYPLTEKDRVLQKTPYNFDVSVWELLWANWYGATIVIAKPEGHKDCDYLYEEIINKKITVIHFVPSMLDIFLEYISFNKKQLQELKTVFCSGEALKLNTVNKFYKFTKDQNTRLYNLYGPTEASIDVSFSICQSNKKVTIGKPIQNTRLYILDKDLKPVSIGVEGELYIGGAGLARGYLNLPELTDKTFISNPFATDKDKQLGYTRLYKTGDLCKWLDNGEIEYIGRNDFQVKVRGFRIELGEIESVISEINNIQQVCIIAKQKRINDQKQTILIAYYISDNGSVDNELIKNYIKAKLPSYMLPNTFVKLDRFPLTINGKLDRKALPEPKLSSREYIAPISKLQRQLCDIWQELLGIEKVGITDNFFELGGNSILAIRVALLISERLNIFLQVGDIFSFNTVENLSDNINNQLREKIVIPVAKGKLWPLSFAQQRLWFIEQFEQGTNAYHVPWLVSLSSDIDIVAFKKAIQAILKRHTVLRTLFKTDNKGQNFQQISNKKLSIKEINYTTKSEFIDSLDKSVNQPFDLTNVYPIRVVLYNNKNHKFTHVLINVHHIATDGWSRDIFANELLQYYKYFAEAKELSLADLSIQYKDFAVWQREYFKNEEIKNQIDYWKEQLSEYQPLNLPTDKLRPKDFELKGLEIPFQLSSELSIKLRELAKNKGCTLYNIMLTGFYILLYKYTTQEDIVIGTPVANRHYPQIQGLIGFFVNNLILREKITVSQTAHDLLRQINEHLIEAQRYQDIPFEQLVEEISIDRDISKHPIFQVMFSVQSFEFENSPEVNRYFKTESLEDIHAVTKFDLLIILNDAKDQLTGTINYATSLFEASTINRFISYYERILNQLVSEFDNKAIQNYDLLTQSEYKKIVYDWNQTDCDYPKEKTIHQLFEEQAKKTPDNIALIFKDQTLTYDQLNNKANQLAYHIRSKYREIAQSELEGDTLICLLLDKSIEMIVAILAVLKSGAAYVPISPEFPQQRIDYILKDTQAQILISQSHLKEKLNKLDTSLNIIYADKECLNYPITNPITQIKPQSLAYVIYTSGTTGKPKGVMIEHKSFASFITLFRYKLAHSKLIDINMLSLTSYVFDIFGLEYALPLVEGGYIVLSSIFDINKTELEQINIIQQTPNVLLELCEKYEGSLNDKVALVGGEKATLKIVDKLLNCFKNTCNVYGPAETVIWSSIHLFRSSSEYAYIGRPLYNEKMYILDKNLNPVPIGIEGELYIGGAGLARGYLNLPKLTQKRFINNPFATEENKQLGYTRLYKTGDLCKWLDNGEIEYIGRNDFQVKVRGHRIELGEIENALDRIDGIKTAKVIAKPQNQSQSLIAYYIYDKEFIKTDNTDSIDHWANLYNDEYQKTEIQNIEDDFTGWNSYITDKPFEIKEMQEWRNATVNTIKTNNIDKVFEIGVGSGLLLYQLLPYVKTYDGIDISKVVIDRYKENLGNIKQQVNLSVGKADEIDQYAISKPYNCVIINSVCQYFPHIKYFRETIQKALKVLVSDGIIFIGDIRDYRHHKTLIKAKYGNQIDENKIDDLAFKENELLIAPEYFINLTKSIPDIAVDIFEKEGSYINELNQYRYDVIIYKQGNIANNEIGYELIKPIPENRLATKLKQVAFEKLAIVIDGIVNPRLVKDNESIQIAEYKQLAEELNLKFKLHRISSLGKDYLSCSFATKDIYSSDIFTKLQIDLDNLYNLRAQSTFSYEYIKQQLTQNLPEYMLPSHFVRLDNLPLTINGKLDRKALPDPTLISDDKKQIPVTPEQTEICKIWQSLLGIAQIGIDQDFFSIGGNSILAIQLAYQISQALETNITVADIFKYKTPKLLAERVYQRNNIIRWLSEPDTSKPMIIFIHPSCAGSEVYQNLADKLSQAYQCLGIDNYNLSHENKITSLAELAKYYLSLIELKNQKVILLGWSLGGLIALEMAYWLDKKDFDVQVVLLDTLFPTKKPLRKLIFDRDFKNICQNMNLANKDKQYIQKLKLNYKIERQLAQSKLSGKINKENIVSFNAKGMRFRQLTKNIISIKANHFGIIKKITDNWDIYKQAFITRDFSKLYKTRRKKYRLLYILLFSVGLIVEEYTLGLFGILGSLEFIQMTEGV